jgi:2-polyprenyl-3-methyl-5-hydroxy-6-metoxy-1,4-benzoquinol methylase
MKHISVPISGTSNVREENAGQAGSGVLVEEVTCPICGAGRPQKIRENHTFDTHLLMCLDCGLFFSSPEVTVQPAAEHYRQGKTETWWQRKILRKVLSEIRAYDNNRRHRQLSAMIDCRIGDEQGILDIGCGNAETLLHLTALRHRGVCIEPCFRQWDRIQGTDIKIYEDVFDDVEIDQKFDVVIMSHLIEHIPAPFNFLSKVQSLMVDDGLLVVETPNSDNYYQRYYDMNQNDEHLFWYNTTNLTSMLVKAGFTEITALTYDCGDFQLDSVINKILRNQNSKIYTGHHSVRIGNNFLRRGVMFTFETVFKYIYTRISRSPLPFYIPNEEDKGLWVISFSRKA